MKINRKIHIFYFLVDFDIINIIINIDEYYRFDGGRFIGDWSHSERVSRALEFISITDIEGGFEIAAVFGELVLLSCDGGASDCIGSE
jgi:hypothetical protein